LRLSQYYALIGRNQATRFTGGPDSFSPYHLEESI